WGFSRGQTGADEYQKLLKETVQPLFKKWKDYCLKEQLLVPQVVYGYYPCQSEGDDLIIYREDKKTEWVRFTFPRQSQSPKRSISDFYLSKNSENFDVFGCFVVTVGTQASDAAHKLFKENAYSDYLYLHGLSVETAEALAEYWHRRIREELNIASEDAKEV